jgi:hypothetical protein
VIEALQLPVGLARTVVVTAVVALSVVLVLVIRPGAAAAATPTLTITPGPSAGSFTNGESVTVSVGPNSLFTPHYRVNIIECADPGGSTANLPVNEKTCDVNTVEADTVLVQPDGSFKETGYTLYALPNAVLGEQANWQPVCNRTDKCVLYVGENQDDFTQPKIFSAPFAFTSSAPTIGGGGAATATTVAAPTAPSASASVSLSPSTLAFTGSSSATFWLVAGGLALVAGGLVGRRTLKKRRWSR